jgi:hypothetical protein
MDAIQEPNHNFNFEKLLLSPPLSISSGNHFIKYSFNNSPLYIQTPKCKIKQGIMKIGKKMFCDLVFSIENEGFTHWLENLENYSQTYIFEKREKWFETSLEKHDIENSFASPIKLIKSGKYFTLRSNIPTILGKHSLKIYNESEQLVELEDLKEESSIVSVLEIQGIKCSTRGFQIDVEIKQLLVLNPVDIFQKCVLLHGNKKNVDQDGQASIRAPHVVLKPGSLGLLCTGQAMLAKDTDTSNDFYSTPLKNVNQTTSIECNEQKDILTLGGYKTLNSNDNDDVLLKIESSDEHNDLETNDGGIKLAIKHDNNIHLHNEQSSLENIVDMNENLSDNSNKKNEISLQDCLSNVESHTDCQTNPDLYTNNLDENMNSIGLTEINFNLEEIPTNDSLVLKNRNDVYYNMYREALRKAKMAKELSLSSYLEAKRIKNIYMLNDLSDEDSDIENDFEIDDNNEK